MSKLFGLKEWLTLPEAARRLTDTFEEQVTDADVLRFVLDGRLKLSVLSVSPVTYRCRNVESHAPFAPFHLD